MHGGLIHRQQHHVPPGHEGGAIHADGLLVSAGALFVPVVVKFFGLGEGVKGGPITFEGKIQMLGFLVFEAMVGIFWPSMMKMRSQYVPEEVRSTVMNFFRIPLNLFVCVILYNVALFPLSAMFAMCALFLVVAAFLQKKLEMLEHRRTASTCLCRSARDGSERIRDCVCSAAAYSKELIRGTIVCVQTFEGPAPPPGLGRASSPGAGSPEPSGGHPRRNRPWRQWHRPRGRQLLSAGIP